MSFKTFISDLQKLPQVKDFENGNDKQRAHLNELAEAIRALRTAADREAGEGNEGDDTFIAYIEDGGESVQYTIYGYPTADGEV